MKRNGKRKGQKFRAGAKLAREAETRAVARACEVARFLAPLPVGAQRTKQAQHGPALPAEMIGSALARSRGILYRAIEYIRANGYPQYSMSALRERIAQDTRLQEIAEESRMGLVCDAVDALHEAVLSGADWAIRQVLNSPLANDLQLGQPSAKVAIDARSISVNDSGVLDSIDLQQRLARLGTALQGLAGGAAPHDPPMDAAPLVVDAEPCALVPSPPCSQTVDNPVDNPDLPTSHNPDYVSDRTIKEPKDTPKQRAKSARKEARKRATKPERKPRELGRDWAPEAAHDAAQVAAATDAGEVAAPPRKRGRPKGSRDSKPRRRRDPRRGKFRATGGGL